MTPSTQMLAHATHANDTGAQTGMCEYNLQVNTSCSHTLVTLTKNDKESNQTCLVTTQHVRLAYIYRLMQLVVPEEPTLTKTHALTETREFHT